MRSALGLAFITACSVRGNPNSPLADLMYTAAGKLEINLPFASSEDEQKCLEAIAQGNGHIGAWKYDADESRRAKLLMKDELGFLAEDLYDIETYI